MNEAQLECVHTINGQVIVIACPGAGKTTTLLARINHMVKEAGIDPEHILMMTFTRSAAAEMRKRYESEPGSKKGVTFSTIHALCLAILIRYRGRPEIMSDDEERDFFFSMLRDSAAKYPSMDIPKGYRTMLAAVSDRDQFINDLVLDIGMHKNNPGKKFKLNSTPDKALFQFLWDRYETLKKQQGKIDFDDMLTQAYEVLLNDKRALAELRDKYRYIQVDEYQDTNYVQRDIVYLLAGENGNLAVVGDDDQSIYGFRGACPEVMLGFPDDYPRAKVIRMGTNYRSARNIIACAGQMIAKNRNRYAKDFIAARPEAGEIELTLGETKAETHRIIAGRVESLLKSGMQDRDIAVLYRTNKETEGIAGALIRRGIEVQVADGVTNRYEHWIYRDICSYYRLANEIGGEGDLARILNHPQRYLQSDRYVWMQTLAETEQQMCQAAYEMNGEFWKVKGAVKEIEDLFRLLRSLKGKPPRTFMSTLYVAYRRYLKDYANFRGMDMEELTSVWESYLSDVKSLPSGAEPWREWEAYVKRYEHAIRQARKSQAGVLLSSMHKAKGLEWEHVIVANCVEGNIPYQNEKRPCDIEEERRLFYVACTRAKKHLELVGYKSRSGKHVNISPFIRELTKA